MNKKFTLWILMLLAGLPLLNAQQSVARRWNEALLNAIRTDLARPTVHARNLFHTSAVMYDAWAAYDHRAKPFLLGNTVGNFHCPFDSVPTPTNVEDARKMAISYAAYRLLRHRFQNSPNAFNTLTNFDNLMIQLGYDPAYTNTNYANGNPAALGNYIAQQMIQFGLQDGSNEQNLYQNLHYQPVNPPLIIKFPGNPNLEDPNRWQPLTLDVFIDQAGNVIPGPTPPFLSPEWGQVVPFSLQPEDRTIYNRNNFDYWVYHDPGPPPYLDTTAVGGVSEEYKWNFELVSIWSSMLAPTDSVIWDISPASIGNNAPLPATIFDYHNFYDLTGGGDQSQGRAVNPRTGQPYTPQYVPRGDYARALAEFWADGPTSETPPGHWFTILNYVNDHPLFKKRYRGQGPIIDDLEWDVKAYFMLGGTMHDVAITAWGIKGWYDYIRPVSAIRGMAERGQSSDPNAPHYHPGGLPLVPGFVELVQSGDPLAGATDENVGKVKLYAWRGPDYIGNPAIDEAGVGWILADNWWPYQRPSFVTPPFAGYISGHSTYSRAAAEVLTMLTGDEYFPGGVGEFHCPQNQFLVFEEGPSVDMTLQWATYRDASDQCSLSRIWGGIHPPADDMPGRKIGIEIGNEAFHFAETYFFRDNDFDGFFDYQDCDDNNAMLNPNTIWYKDQDGDGYSDGSTITQCEHPFGYYLSGGLVQTSGDCNDNNPAVNPTVAEVCNGLDDDCDGTPDQGLEGLTYFGDVVFHTQADVDAWPGCYAVIEGRLLITGSAINDLSPLLGLTEVTGDVELVKTHIVNLTGLDNLVTVGGNVAIWSNTQLESLQGLQALQTTGGKLTIMQNGRLSDCCAIQPLLAGNGIGGMVRITGNQTGCESVSDINAACLPPFAPLAQGSISQPEACCDAFLYPNPTSGELQVYLSSSIDAEVSLQITDILGNSKYQQFAQIAAGAATIAMDQVNSLPSGTYLLIVKVGGQAENVLKFVKL